jgi:hypothetical protein
VRKEAAVGDLDAVLPVVRSLARHKANAFVHRCWLASHEREDVESQLLLTLSGINHVQISSVNT